MRSFRCRGGLAVALAALCWAGVAAAAERSETPEKYTWNLADIYKDEAAWTAAKDDLLKRIPELEAYQGHLGDSADKLLGCLTTAMQMQLQMGRLQSYAFMLADQDRRDSHNIERQQLSEQVGVKLQTAASFITPEVLAVGSKKVQSFVAAQPKLGEFRQYLDDILRRAPHTLSPAEEKVYARSGNVTGTGQDVHGMFTSADLPYPEVTLSTGEKVRLDAAAYTRYRAATNRADRDLVFKSFWGTYSNYKRTLGVALYAQVKGHIFNKEVHKFDSCLDAALFENNIPRTVYTQLIKDVHDNLPTLHRYLKLRQKMLGVDQLRYEDLYTPIVAKVDVAFTPEQSMDATLAAVAPLGPDYVAALKKGFESRWVDFLPNTGKRSGAYSQGIYDVHPYQLQNFMGRYEDVSTVAHESGHSMHSYLSAKNQPFVNANYAIFVAEVASTLNENLLLHSMLDKEKDDTTRLALLGSYLDGMRQTLFRQTLFAEFELGIHDMAERGETLSGDNMTERYGKLIKEYYGDAQGVCKVDDLYGVEWAYIPHFYYNFYVFQYATSMIASNSIAAQIRADAAQAKPSSKSRDAYIKMLSSGSAKYPIDLLKDAGVDMTTSKPFQAAMAEMNRVMDEMESILAKSGKH